MPVEYYAEEMELFWKFIFERHQIYQKKVTLQCPPPWTDNRLLADYRYTNVFRELDRGTRFVIEHIDVEELEDNDWLFNVIVYRLFNKIETYLTHGYCCVDSYDPIVFETRIRERASVDKVFTNAFVVSGYSQFGAGMDKIKRLSILIGQLAKQLKEDWDSGFSKIILETTDLERVYTYLRSVNGVGPFLGYQIAIDLSYSHRTLFGEDEYVVDGPGAKRGLQELFPAAGDRGMGYEYLNFWLRDKQGEFFKDYDIPDTMFADRSTPYLTVMDLENCLCEFSKMIKAFRGAGRPRNTFNTNLSYQGSYLLRNNDWMHDDYSFDKFDKEANRNSYKRFKGR